MAQPLHCEVVRYPTHYHTEGNGGAGVNSIVYLVGAIVIIIVILKLLGLY